MILDFSIWLHQLLIVIDAVVALLQLVYTLVPAAAADDLSLEGFPLEMTLVNWSVGPSSGSHRSLFFLSLP